MSPKVLSLRGVLSVGAVVTAAISHEASAQARTAPAPSAGVLGFYRQPAIRGDRIVFTAEGDLWTVPVSGGVAQRLTTHPAAETNPVISPDGRTIAFTARYEGPAQLYTMPIAGGMPVRRTFEPENSIATAWTPDGKVVYTTTRYSGIPKLQMVQLDPASGERTLVPLAGASEGAWDATGRTVFFARPGFHNNVTKLYRGGTARDIWKYTSGAAEAVEVSKGYDGESHSPMLWNGRVYFVTDRDSTMNLWSMDTNGGDLRQHTRHKGWDVRTPSLDAGRIVYQFGADLWLFDIASGQTRQLAITLASDLDQLRERWVTDPMASLTSAHLSPEGDRLVLTSRGRVFTAPVRQGRLVRVTRKDSVRYRDAVFADARNVLAFGDESGEFEVMKLPANGVGRDTALTRNGTVLRFELTPSPDGKRVAWTDNDNNLWVMAVGGAPRKINAIEEGVGDLTWSPDSRWLAYAAVARNTFQQIMLYDADSARTLTVTSDRVNSSNPAWDTRGEFLYFLSDRNLQSVVGAPWGARAPEPYFDRPIEVYQVALRAGLRSPFAPNDELAPRAATRADTGAAARAVRIDAAGLEQRVRRVPVPAGNYRGLAASADGLFFIAAGSGADTTVNLMGVRFTNERPTPTVIAEGVRSFELSANARRLLLRRGNTFHVVDARVQRITDLADSRVDLGGWTFPIDVRADWRQIFVDAWRMERDYFYDRALHGLDYQRSLAKYLPLVDRITTREELSDLIGWLVGDLSALHTSVGGGDTRRGPDNVGIASLGARLLRDAAAGGYRIERIYQHDPDYPDTRSPLADPELDVRAGDVVTAINGVALAEVADIGVPLRNQAGRQVLLTLRRGATSRDVVVSPIGNEAALRYTDWEVTRRQAVEQAGKGAIGYVHIRAMGTADIEQFYREFYPVFNRQGLIIDVRQNRGGNIDSWLLEKLMRKAWMYWKSRAGEPYWNMQYAFRGHMVVLVDHETASDGEAFADGFRRLGLGQVIGTRTWGGEIWLSGVNVLTDGGVARAPMNGVYGPERKWLIEQRGLEPDIEVDNLPHATFMGKDAQLEAAIAHLQQKIAQDPREVPAPPPFPKRGVPPVPPER
ncbi:MAG: PDZ domain-containing protein [Gemmatimonadetes bacterium]|nr:PDZ domain-containing protein [Gemmatimonadota bacterium]